jgi:uncharacterized protein YkwD
MVGTKTKYVVTACVSVVATIVVLTVIGFSMESEVITDDEHLPLQSDENIIESEPDTEYTIPTLTKVPLALTLESFRDKNGNLRSSLNRIVTAGDTQFYASTLESEIHYLINIERKKHGLEPLVYDKVLALAARQHSKDMVERDYFSHATPEGLEPMDRGHSFGYYECGDPDTIHLFKEYDKLAAEYDALLAEYEAGGSTDYVMYDKLDQMYNTLEQKRMKLNQLSITKLVFEGIGENIAQNSLYEQAWYLEGEIVSYDWNSYEQIAESTVDGWMKSPNHKENILEPSWQSEGIGIFATDYMVYITQNFC